jgi:hypothetical protein
MSHDPLENETDVPRRRWGGHLTLPMLLLLGWLLYELTAQPALGVAAVCLKFGWEDFRTAGWLRRRDPDRRRGRAAFWLYTASGLWKSAITASVMIFAFAFVKGLQEANRAPAPRGQPRDGIPPQVIGALLTAFGSYVLSTLATCAALFLALWYRLKLWLDAGVHRARRDNLWPPPDDPAPRTNKAGRVVLTALILTIFTGGFAALVAVAVGVSGRQLDAFGLLLVLAVLVLLMFGVPVAILVGRDLLARRVFAAAPSECWGTVPAGETLWAALDQPDLDRAPGY